MFDLLEVLPPGPALPPGKSMNFKTKFIRRTIIRILNENEKFGPVSVDGIGEIVPGATGRSVGVLDLSRAWNLGKVVTVKNQCDWVLIVESKL